MFVLDAAPPDDALFSRYAMPALRVASLHADTAHEEMPIRHAGGVAAAAAATVFTPAMRRRLPLMPRLLKIVMASSQQRQA